MKASKENKTKVLRFLSNHEERGYLFGRTYIARETEMVPAAALTVLRALKKEGLVYSDTMFDEDGLLAGVGWSVVYGADLSGYLPAEMDPLV